ncbi:MAG: universal stress protein [Dialister sp.]
MTEAKSLIPDSIDHDLLFEIGEPVPMILYLAGQTKADLIIMGNRGRSTWKSLLMGSVSRDVLSNAKCPVIIIK